MAERVPTVVGGHPRLSERTLSRSPSAIIRPTYDRRATQVGVVHFGPGAFHRAHQAEVFDRIPASNPRFRTALEKAYERLADPASALFASGR